MIIYLIGFLCTYALCKFIRYKQDENKWEDIGVSFVLSFFSWLSFIALLIIMLIEYIEDHDTKPPKWL